MSSHPQVPGRIGNWIPDECLGSGYSGSIWRASNPYSGQIAALKLQDVNHECPTNRYERYFYPCLQGGIGMPTLLASGVEGKFDYLVIDLLGPSLDNLYRKNGRVMDLRSTLCIAMQVISRLELMHHRGILHRDIQLGNCVVGLPPNDKLIYMIDFGFSKMYIDPQTRSHIPNSRAKRDFIGNYWFSSVNVHCRGKVPSRRDDLEALALMLIHMLTPDGLPWTRNGIPRDEDDHDRLIEEKRLARPDNLCRGLPSVFEEFLRYCRRLKFFDQPDYAYWRTAFADVAKQHGFVENDGNVSDELHWPPKPYILPTLGTTKKKVKKQTTVDLELEKVLGELANLNLGGSLKNPPGINNPEPTPQNTDNSQNLVKASPSSTDVIVISSDASSTTTSNSLKRGERRAGRNQQFDRQSKAAAIRRLTAQVREAVTNYELAGVVHDFTELFHAQRSKVVTKDAFELLASLARQLEDPSIFVVRSGQTLQTSEKSNSDARAKAVTCKGATVKTLYLGLSSDQQQLSNLQIANFILQFSDAMRATSNKNLSKDGFAFLSEIESRLRQS